MLLCVIAVAISCLLQYSLLQAGFISDSGSRLLNPFTMQIFAGCLGFAAMLLVAAFPYRMLSRLWFVHLPLTLSLVLLTFTNLSIVYTPPGSDDSAWLKVGGLSLQPAELLKVSFVLTFAYHLSKVREGINRPSVLLPLCLHGLFPCALIFFQGDMGTALVFFFIFVVMIFAAGLSVKFLALGAGLGAVGAVVLWVSGLLPDPIKNRFLILLDLESDPAGAGYQQLVGRRILGSGELLGKGLFSDDLNWVFALENDFILAHIGQTLGFLGCVGVLAVLLILCFKMLLNARQASDPLGCYICVGVFSIFLFQTIINVGMVLCVLPVVGITLPLISAGGTSLITSFLSIGLVMNVYFYQER